MLASMHRLCLADRPSKVLVCLGKGFFIGKCGAWVSWQLKAEVCLALGLCWAFQSTLFIPWDTSPGVAEGEPGGSDEGLCCCGCCFRWGHEAHEGWSLHLLWAQPKNKKAWKDWRSSWRSWGCCGSVSPPGDPMTPWAGGTEVGRSVRWTWQVGVTEVGRLKWHRFIFISRQACFENIVFDRYLCLTPKLLISAWNIYKHFNFDAYSGVLVKLIQVPWPVLSSTKLCLIINKSCYLSVLLWVRLGEQSSSLIYWSAGGHLSSALFLALFGFFFFPSLFWYNCWATVTSQQIKELQVSLAWAF